MKIVMKTTTTAPTKIHTLIVGGGHAGVNLACRLELDKHRKDYLIIEQADSLMHKWRKNRWDFFQLNAPVKYSRLFGQDDGRDDWRIDRPIQEDIDAWDKHVEKVGINYQLHTRVNKVTRNQDDGHFVVETTTKKEGSSTPVAYTCRNLVVCSGLYGTSSVPSDNTIPNTIKQHVTGGFHLKDLQDGNVLIVGGGQSGCQISDLLLQHEPNRNLYLCTSQVPACPRSYRGKELFWWLEKMGFITFPKQALVNLPAPQAQSMRYGKAPVTGPNKPISPFSLARQGVELLGRFDSVDDDGRTLTFLPNRAEYLNFILNAYNNFKSKLDAFAQKMIDANDNNIEPDVPEPEWNNVEPDLLKEPGRLSISIEEANITNIIWAIGWDTDLSWFNTMINECQQEDFDKRTHLPDTVISKSIPGLFYAGFPWIGTLQSMTIINMDQDAAVIADALLD